MTRTEQERDQWEKKYEVSGTYVRFDYSWPLSDTSNGLSFRYIIQDMKAKYEQSKKDLDDLVVSMETV